MKPMTFLRRLQTLVCVSSALANPAFAQDTTLKPAASPAQPASAASATAITGVANNASPAETSPAKPAPTPNTTGTPTAPTPTPAPGATPAATPVPTASPAAVPLDSPSPSPAATRLDGGSQNPNAPVKILELSLDDKSGQSLSLEDSIKIAIQSSSDVLKAENDQDFNGSRLLQAYGQFLPSLYGSTSYAYDTGHAYSVAATPVLVQGTTRNANASITADLNLFNGVGDYANLKSSLLKKDASDLTVERAKETIALDVAQSFLQVVLDTKLVGIAKKNLQASEEREKLLEAQTEVGVKNLSDLFRQQAQTSLDESTLLSSENKNRTDQIILLRKLRLDVNKPYHFVDPQFPENQIERNPVAEQQLIDQGLKNRADLKAYVNTANADHWDVHTAAANYFPKIDLIGNIYSGAHTLDDQTVNGAPVFAATSDSLGRQLGKQIEYTIALNLTWNIFDRFVTKENVNRAQAIAGDADIDAENRRLQVQGEVRQSYGDYLTAIQQLHSSKKGYDAAQKAYEVMEGRYSVGAASFLDLITSQSTLVQAESNRVQAIINYDLQGRALDVAVGKKIVY